MASLSKTNCDCRRTALSYVITITCFDDLPLKGTRPRSSSEYLPRVSHLRVLATAIRESTFLSPILAPAVSPKPENRVGFCFENSLHDQLAALTLSVAVVGFLFPDSLLLDFHCIADPHLEPTLITAVQTWIWRYSIRVCRQCRTRFRHPECDPCLHDGCAFLPWAIGVRTTHGRGSRSSG